MRREERAGHAFSVPGTDAPSLILLPTWSTAIGPCASVPFLSAGSSQGARRDTRSIRRWEWGCQRGGHCGVCMPKAWVGSQASCSPGHPALAGSEPGGCLCLSRGNQCQSLRAGKVMLIYTIFKQVYFTQLCSQARFLIDPTRSHTHAPYPHEHLGACAQGHLWVTWGQGTPAVKSS